MTMMGELRIIEGSLSIKGSIGYVPQQAWVFSGSVKQNIVFGQAYEEDRYDKVVRACCLEQVRIWFSFYQDISGVWVFSDVANSLWNKDEFKTQEDRYSYVVLV